ncbi:Replicase polyprotein 1ab [Actinoplanes sp. DH11]|uniref:Replicase polyprotein 1ab n=1 Tax=Actinoplanes sp. DH11 TaxID=2857011 RepID=UPI001E41E0DB|nr:Replicase polyprotein 1ab [Actinoplanes sp. DH11]
MADKVARHLVAAGQIIDEDSELALQHAIAARRLASRIAVVREAVGLAAYAAGDWTTAIAELRTYHRMTGRQTHLAELADCERALGRPERAIDLFRGADMAKLEKSGAIELLIVAAGARGDLGQHDAAVAMLQVNELTANEDAEWAARLRYAYADALLAADRRDEAREWFARAAAVDDEQLTNAAERLLELDGVSIEGDDEDEDEETEAALGEGGPEVRSEDDDDSEEGSDASDEPLDTADDLAADEIEDDEDGPIVGDLDDEDDEQADLADLDVNSDALVDAKPVVVTDSIDEPADEDDADQGDADEDDADVDEDDVVGDDAAEAKKAAADEFVAKADEEQPKA